MVAMPAAEKSGYYSRGAHLLPEPRFRETAKARLARWGLGAAYALQPRRIGLMPRLTSATAAHLLRPVDSLEQLLQNPCFYRDEGFVGISNDLSVDALLNAYRRGILPVCHIGPMKWWSPAERAVLFFEEAHIEKGTRKQIRREEFDVTFDHDFAAVMRACAEPRSGKTPLTWLSPRVMRALWDLHKAGYAHSVEVWDAGPELVGGMFGIAIGRVFFGESQFSRVSGASKVASTVLNAHLQQWGFVLRDAKWMSDHLAGLGFRPIARQEFEKLLSDHVSAPSRVGPWETDETLDVAKWTREGPNTPSLSPIMAGPLTSAAE